MLDRQWMLEREDRRDDEMREWQERMEKARHRSNLFWLGLVATLALVGATIGAAFVERGGQPTINNIIQPQQSTPGKGVLP